MKRYLRFKDPGLVNMIEQRYAVRFSNLEPVVGTSRVTISGSSHDSCKLACYDLRNHFSNECGEAECSYGPYRANIPKTTAPGGSDKGVSRNDVVHYVDTIVRQFPIAIAVNHPDNKITLFGPKQEVAKAKIELDKKLKALKPPKSQNAPKVMKLDEQQLTNFQSKKQFVFDQFKKQFDKKVSLTVSEKKCIATFTCADMKVCFLILMLFCRCCYNRLTHHDIYNGNPLHAQDFVEATKWLQNELKNPDLEYVVTVEQRRAQFLRNTGVLDELSDQYNVSFEFRTAKRMRRYRNAHSTKVKSVQDKRSTLKIKGLGADVTAAASSLDSKIQELQVFGSRIKVGLSAWESLKQQLENIANSVNSSTIMLDYPKCDFNELKPQGEEMSIVKDCLVSIIYLCGENIDHVKSLIGELKKQYETSECGTEEQEEEEFQEPSPSRDSNPASLFFLKM